MTIRNRALRLGVDLHHKGVPVLPWMLRVAFWGEWECRLIGHALVPNLPMCFRCESDWPSWEDVPR